MSEPIATPGPQHRTGRVGRPHPLDDPEFAKLVAEAFVAGSTRAEMCEMFAVKDPNTITRWKRDPRVKAISMKLVEDRVVQITRKVDGKIEQMLADADDLTVKELIMIRKEFLGGAFRAQVEKADDATVNEAMQALEANPDFAGELAELIDGAKKK